MVFKKEGLPLHRSTGRGGRIPDGERFSLSKKENSKWRNNAANERGREKRHAYPLLGGGGLGREEDLLLQEKSE